MRNRRCAIPMAWLAVLTLGGPLATGAQETDEAPVFRQLAGAWEGEGALMGRDAVFRMSWSVEHGLAVLRFENAFASPDGPRTVLASAAVYRTATTTPEAIWFDTRGVQITIRWEAADDALIAHWTAPTEEGRTTYRVTAPDRVEVLDEVRGAEGWRVFAQATYGRVEQP